MPRVITETPTLELSSEHGNALGLGIARPRISWKVTGEPSNWTQQGYKLEITRAASTKVYEVTTAESILVPWPAGETDLSSGERVSVDVTVRSDDGRQASSSKSLVIEAALLKRDDWSGVEMISCGVRMLDEPKRPFRLVKRFVLKSIPSSARIYATAWGIYNIWINGERLGDLVFSPGWTSYKYRLKYQTYDIAARLQQGSNTIYVDVGEGWFNGRLAWAGRRNIFGERNGFFAKVVIGHETIKTDGSWLWAYGPLITSEIYDGEVFDGRIAWPDLDSKAVEWKPVDVLPFHDATRLLADPAPVRPSEVLEAIKIITTPTGKTVVDFGQNLVGFVRINRDLIRTSGSKEEIRLLLSHAEVLDEHGEVGMKELRSAKCVDTIIVGQQPIERWTPTFTFHGFRFVQIEGWTDEALVGGSLTLEDLSAVVVHTDLERTGHFECSNEKLNRLHSNVVWSMRGNFLSIPTDCPQRDERLGWTGDMAVFGPTAAFLYDVTAMLSDWMQDVSIEQHLDPLGRPPMVVPNVLSQETTPHPTHCCAIWGDVTILTPWDMYMASGDIAVLSGQFDSMKLWLEKGVQRDPTTELWAPDSHQFGDWLDPKAPANAPDKGQTDAHLVADAYLVQSTARMADICMILRRVDEAGKYMAQHTRLTIQYRNKYLSQAQTGLQSHSQAAYALALHTGLLKEGQERQRAAGFLEELVVAEDYRVGTGFAGTPIILDTLADNDRLDVAYKMLLQPENPGWMYMLSKDATTMWERWDSVLPDGSLNESGMTSLNHFSLGSVGAFLHRVVGGISALEPGWRRVLVKPRPAGGLEHASADFNGPYGLVSCHWKVDRSVGKLVIHVKVPANTTARVELPGQEPLLVGSGKYAYSVDLDHNRN